MALRGEKEGASESGSPNEVDKLGPFFEAMEGQLGGPRCTGDSAAFQNSIDTMGAGSLPLLLAMVACVRAFSEGDVLQVKMAKLAPASLAYSIDPLGSRLVCEPERPWRMADTVWGFPMQPFMASVWAMQVLERYSGRVACEMSYTPPATALTKAAIARGFRLHGVLTWGAALMWRNTTTSVLEPGVPLGFQDATGQSLVYTVWQFRVHYVFGSQSEVLVHGVEVVPSSPAKPDGVVTMTYHVEWIKGTGLAGDVFASHGTAAAQEGGRISHEPPFSARDSTRVVLHSQHTHGDRRGTDGAVGSRSALASRAAHRGAVGAIGATAHGHFADACAAGFCRVLRCRLFGRHGLRHDTAGAGYIVSNYPRFCGVHFGFTSYLAWCIQPLSIATLCLVSPYGRWLLRLHRASTRCRLRIGW